MFFVYRRKLFFAYNDFSLVSLSLFKMAYEVIGSKHKIKRYKLLFLNTEDSHVRKIRFTNYDKHDRREALKKFLDVSFVRHKLEADKELELIENDPTMKYFLTANHSSYGNMLRTAMSSFVTKNQKLSSTNIREQIDPRPRVLMENPNAFILLFQDRYKHDNKNPRARFNNFIGRKDHYHVRKRQFQEKVEREKRKLESDKKRRKIDDGDDFNDNGDPIYRDGEGSIIHTFKTKGDGTNNNLLDGALDLNNIWNLWGKETQPGENPEAAPETKSEPGASEPGEEVLDVDDEDRKETDVTLIRFFQNVERKANKTLRFNVDQYEYEDRIDDYPWARFAAGYKDNNYLRITNEIERRGLNTSENRDFIDYLATDECERVMERNDITIHVESGEYLVEELETGESLKNFLALQTDEDKKVIRTVLRYSGPLKSFIEDYMESALGTEEKWLPDSDVFVYSKYLVANHKSQ